MPDSFEARLDAARVARTAGRVDDALAGYSSVAVDARAAGDLRTLSHALRHVSEIERDAGDAHGALAAGEEAVAACRKMAAPPLELANALRVAALALETVGRSEDAVPLWQEARARYLDVGVSDGVDECDQHLPTASTAAER
jgi:hypothetical protein